MSPPFRHDRYLDHAELTTWLEQRVAEAHELATLTTIGYSHQQRPIHCVTITQSSTGAADQKPALHIDANNHGEEVITSAVALYTIDLLLREYSHDPEVTELLNTRSVYIIPRLNPDGAEYCLHTPYRSVGNGHYLPWQEHPRGLRPEDVDGDGRILQMLVPDTRGEWRRDPKDKRLLILREPGEIGGPFFRMLPEGILRDWDGATYPIEKPRHGNLNRQFPSSWAPEFAEYGAGQLPLNEPEAAALARFVIEHPNIAGVQAYHSHGAIILRPSANLPDSELNANDLDTFLTIGAVGTRITGYPVLSTFESFTPDKKNPRHGGFTEWCYQQLGRVAFTNELWNVEREIGQASGKFFEDKAQGPELQRALLSWSDHHAPDAFHPWRPVTHPQLGEVLIGGWDPFLIFRNPPPAMIAAVAEPNARFTIRHALASPLLEIDAFNWSEVAAGVHKLVAVVSNSGYLPTNLTQRGEAVGIAEIEVELVLPDGLGLITGTHQQRIGHLAGRSTRRGAYDPWRRPWGESTRVLEWLVGGAGDPSHIEIRAQAPQAGRAVRRAEATHRRRILP